MPVTVFTITEYNDVRSAVDIELTADNLPNSVIASPIFEATARRYVDNNVSAETIDANGELATSIAVLYCAALILPSINQVVKEDIPGGLIQYQAKDLKSLAEQRFQMAAQLLADLQGLDTGLDPTTTVVPIIFCAAGSGRKTTL